MGGVTIRLALARVVLVIVACDWWSRFTCHHGSAMKNGVYVVCQQQLLVT